MSHKSIPKAQIEAIQTVPPYTVTEPRQVLKVSIKDSIVGSKSSSSIFKAALNIIIFCGNDDGDDDEEEEVPVSGWVAAGWIKESLSIAFKDQPLLSGRLRRCESDLEIVANDSGARLFEAKIDVTLKDFLVLEDVKKAQFQLVYWKDIDELNPQFSPLFYIQVTNFKCGAYSIGMSCSLLFADILIMDNFLHKWAKIHRDIFPKNNEPTLPIFYLPNLKPPNSNLNGLFPSTTEEKISQTVIYKINSQMVDLKENLALFCLEEAENKFRITKTSPEFGFLVKESPVAIKARNWKKCEIVKSRDDEVVILKTSDLKECMRMNELYLREGTKPAMTSYWIGSADGGVYAIAVPSYEKLGDFADLNIIITIPPESGNGIVN